MKTLRRLLMFILGVLLLIADAPVAIAFAREMYGPLALLLFVITTGIGASGLTLIILSMQRRRQPDGSVIRRRF